jgi:hypothetical protein
MVVDFVFILITHCCRHTSAKYCIRAACELSHISIWTLQSSTRGSAVTPPNSGVSLAFVTILVMSLVALHSFITIRSLSISLSLSLSLFVCLSCLAASLPLPLSSPFRLLHSCSDVLAEDEMLHSENVFPVFIFSLSSSRPLLLDRFHQAMSFPDMVIAVQTLSGSIGTDYSLVQNSVPFFFSLDSIISI